MDTCGYDRMQEESAVADDERQVVTYPMVTYNPETTELHPEITGQRPRKVQLRVLRCTFLISLSNASLAAVCMIFALIAQSMSGSNYEACLAVCSLVLVDSCLVWCVRHQGKKISQEGALERVWTTRIFVCCFVFMDAVAVCSVVVAGIALYILERGEVVDCYEAFNKIGNLEANRCHGDAETRFFISVLTVTLLAGMGILSMLILGFSMSMARNFSFKSAAGVKKVIVTQVNERGHSVIYRYTDQQVEKPHVEQNTDQQYTYTEDSERNS